MQALVAGAADGDVVAVMCHSERAEIADWLAEHAGTPDDATTIGARSLPPAASTRPKPTLTPSGP